MRILIARLVSLCCIALTVVSALTLDSCKDKFATEVRFDTTRDTLHRTDTLRDTIHHFRTDTLYDTINGIITIRDTQLVPDINVWILRNSGTGEDIVSGSFRGTFGYLGGTRGAVIRTPDAGATWQVATTAPIFNSSFGPGAIYGMAFTSPTQLFAAGDQRVIVRSLDGATSWEFMDDSNFSTFDLVRSLYFVDSMNGFVGTADYMAAPSGHIGKTTDGGQTWTQYFATQGGIYMLYFNGTNGLAMGRFGVCYWSNDRGTTWNRGSTDQANAIMFHVAFTTPTIGFATASEVTGSTGYILRTVDGGRNWTTIRNTPYPLQGLAYNGVGRITAVGGGGHVVESNDSGNSWNEWSVGTNRWNYANYITPTRLLIAGVGGQIATRDK